MYIYPGFQHTLKHYKSNCHKRTLIMESESIWKYKRQNVIHIKQTTVNYKHTTVDK